MGQIFGKTIQTLIICIGVFLLSPNITKAELEDNLDRNASLSNPVYSFWNGFLSMTNILELINTGSSSLTATITLYDLSGNALGTPQVVPINAGSQFDVIVNSLEGFSTTSYGLIKVEFSHYNFDGRMSFYRYGATGSSFEFAFSLPFANYLTGSSYVSFNTFQPSLNVNHNEYLVAQWLSIANLNNSESKTFTINRYDQSGNLLATQQVTVAPLGLVDVEGGHINPGPGYVGLNEIIPLDNNAPYLARLSRYGGNATPGIIPDSYAFTLMHLARQGNGNPQYLAISNATDSANWIEITNVLNQSVSIGVEFYDSTGSLLQEQTIQLDAHAQRHLSVDSILSANTSGAVKLAPQTANSIIAQTMFYFRDTGTGSINSVYTAIAKEVFGPTITGSYNLFIGMANWLRLINTTDNSLTTTVSLATGNNQLSSQSITIPSNGRVELSLHDTDTYNTTIDTYGTITISGHTSGSLFAELLRSRSDSTGEFDFAFTTDFRRSEISGYGPSDSVPACTSGETFSVSPMDSSNFTQITPLGNTDAPGHTFPTVHTYIGLTDNEVAAPVYAPGNITISEVTSLTVLSTNKTDYVINFYPCKDIRGYFDHVTTLTDSLLNVVGEFSECNNYSIGDENYRSCTKSVSISVTAGTLLGYAGGPTTTGSAALDFGLRDFRTVPAYYVNPERLVNGNMTHVVCPYDYYEDGSAKDLLFTKLRVARTEEPVCGKVDHDIKNTAQGLWYLVDSESSNSEVNHIALVPSNFDPNYGVLSVGNSAVGTNEYHFVFQDTGKVKAKFSSISANGNKYCFDSLRTRASESSGSAIDGYLFLTMPTANTLTLERKSSGSCPSNPNSLSFSSSAVSFER